MINIYKVFGMVVGGLIFSFLFDGVFLLTFLGSFVGWLVSAALLDFFKYRKMNYKALLRRHEDQNFSNWSLQELEYIRHRLADEFFLRICNDHEFYCSVDEKKWLNLNKTEKITFCKISFSACLKINNGFDYRGNYIVYAHDSNFKRNYNWKKLNVFIPDNKLLSEDEFYKLKKM